MTITMSISAFFLTVSHIVTMCPEKKVSWIDATGVVASVQHEQSDGDAAVGKLPCHTMGVQL